MLLRAMPEQGRLHGAWSRQIWMWLHTNGPLWTKLHNTWVWVAQMPSEPKVKRSCWFLVICLIIRCLAWSLQLSSSPGSKCPWSRRPTLSTTFSPTSRASGTSSTTSRFSGMPSWDMCWHVSVSDLRQKREDWKSQHYTSRHSYSRLQRSIEGAFILIKCIFFSSPSSLNRQSPDFQRGLWLQKLGSIFQPFLLYTHPPPCARRLPNTHGSSRWVLFICS